MVLGIKLCTLEVPEGSEMPIRWKQGEEATQRMGVALQDAVNTAVAANLKDFVQRRKGETFF